MPHINSTFNYPMLRKKKIELQSQCDSNSNNVGSKCEETAISDCDVEKSASNASISTLSTVEVEIESNEESLQASALLEAKASGSGSVHGNCQCPNIAIHANSSAGCIPFIPSLNRLSDLLPKSLRQIDTEKCEANFDEDLHHRFRRAINADTKIAIGSKEFPCHLVLLQSYSKYLQRFKRPPETVYRLELPEDIISENHFPSLMNWILLEGPCKSSIITKDNVVPLYAAGYFLEIPDLMEQCCEYMSEAMQNNNPIILHLYEQAKCPKFKQLRHVLSTKLAEMFDVLYESMQFLSIGLEDFIVILDSDDVNIQSELDIFHAASRWLLYDWEDRSKHTVRLMKCVRFGLLTSLQLTQIRHCPEVANMADYAQIFSFSEVKDMLNDGLTYAIFRENFESQSEELNKWLDWSNVNHPRKRNCLLKISAIDCPNPSVTSGLQFDVSKHSINSKCPSACKSSLCSTPVSQSILKTSRSAVPSKKLVFVDEVDDPTPLLSNRKPPQQTNTRQSTLQDPFTLASVLRSRIRDNNGGYRTKEE